MTATPSENSEQPGTPESGDPSARRARGLLIALFVIGFLLRLYPVLWGSIFYDEGQFSLHSDEPKMMRYVDDFPESLADHHDYRYPTFMHNVWGAAWAGVGGLLDLRDELPSEVGQPSYERALVFGRLLNILLFGLGGMVLTWAFARRLFGPRVALWSLAATNLFGWAVASTALVQTDVSSSVGLLAVFYLLLDVESAPRLLRSKAVFVGLALGAAISMKYTAAVGALAVTLMALRHWLMGRSSLVEALGFCALAALTTIVAFLVFVPGAIYDTVAFYESIQYEFQDKAVGNVVTLKWYLKSMHSVLPLWLLVPAMVGAVIAVKEKPSTIVTSVVLCVLIYMGVTARGFKPDYGILVVPYAAIFSGLAACRLARSRLLPGSAALALAWLVFGHLYTARAVWGRYALDTRYLFQEWVQEHIPAGPLGEGPRASARPYWSCPKVPPNYEFISVHKRPEWVVLNQRDYYTALSAIDAGEKRFHGLNPADMQFYRDVLRGERKKYRYDLVESIEPKVLPLDKQGKTIQIYRKAR